MSIAWLILSGIVGIMLGWAAAHSTVARECDRLGKFYVGSKVYECKRVDSGVPLKGE